MTRYRFRGVLAALASAAVAFGSSTTAWEMNSYQDFIKGSFTGVSLSRDGRLSLAPRLETVFTSNQPAVWCVAQAPDGSLYLGSGHRGRLFRVDKGGAGSVVWTAPEPEIFAVSAGPDGAVYAGTSPDGKIYRIVNGKAEEYFNPGAKYIWALVVAADGSLYAGTGDQGRIYRVSGPGKGEVWYETGQTHVTSLALDREGRLLVGSEPNGILYRVTGKDKAFVLYDANLPEIRSIIPAADGSVYAAALGGSLQTRTAAAGATAGQGGGTTQVTAPTTTITVTDDSSGAQTGLDFKPKAGEQKSSVTSTIQPTGSATSQPVEMMGVEKSAIYRINPDNTVETLWTSKEENAYDVLVSGGNLLIATDGQGRIYRLTPDHRLTLLVQTNEGEATRLLASGGSLLAVTGTNGKLFRLEETSSLKGAYESPVHDAGTVARWGQLNWRAGKPANSRLAFRTRSGNSLRPDKTWSDWSAPLNDPRSAAITSPNARFLQWRAEFEGPETPVLTSVSAAYLPQNTPPVVKSVTVTTQLGQAQQGAGRAAAAAPVSPGATGTYSITVTDTGDAGQTASSGTPTQPVARGLIQQIVVSWVAEDDDGDRLSYTIYFRAEDESQWKLLKANIPDTSLTVDGDVFADGKYLFRVVASDKPSNTPSTAREAEMISPPVLFDNTPPKVTVGAPRRDGGHVEVDVDASDEAGPLRRAEYSLDAGPWVPMDAVDGIIDSAAERFHVRLDGVGPGEHVLVFRVYDSASNAGLAKVVVQ
jgi:hypothetical protein